MTGASPIETDNGRGFRWASKFLLKLFEFKLLMIFRPDQWARFCGRHSCAEMIETTARAKLLDKSAPTKWHHDIIPRSKTSPVPHNNNTNNILQQNNHSGGEFWFDLIGATSNNLVILIIHVTQYQKSHKSRNWFNTKLIFLSTTNIQNYGIIKRKIF